VGLAPGLSEDRILAVCDAVMKHNYSDEGGLRNASYPVDFAGRRVFHTFNNSQADANWTGIEYLFAALLYACGRTEDSHKIVANIDERHARAGRRWNHLECGDHYYRAMSSWTLMLAASGFVPDVPNNRLTVVPVEGEVRAPWVSSTGWGRMEWEDGRLGLICEGGSISFGELCVKSPTASARVNGGVVRAAISRTDQVTTLKFDGTITLASGDTLLTE